MPFRCIRSTTCSNRIKKKSLTIWQGSCGGCWGGEQPELEVRIARQTVHLPLKKIYYAMAQNHFVKVVTDDGECRAAANFAQVQEQLMTQPDFLVCNRGVIINMSKVLRFDGECIEMLDGARLPVRQKDKKSLLAQFTQYQFRNMQRQM